MPLNQKNQESSGKFALSKAFCCTASSTDNAFTFSLQKGNRRAYTYDESSSEAEEEEEDEEESDEEEEEEESATTNSRSRRKVSNGTSRGRRSSTRKSIVEEEEDEDEEEEEESESESEEETSQQKAAKAKEASVAKMLQLLKTLVVRITRNRNSWPFVEPVDKAEVSKCVVFKNT